MVSNLVVHASLAVCLSAFSWLTEAQSAVGATGLNPPSPPSEEVRAAYAERMVPLLSDEQALLQEKIRLIEAKKVQLLMPYDEANALAVRDQEHALMRRFQSLYARRKNALGATEVKPFPRVGPCAKEGSGGPSPASSVFPGPFMPVEGAGAF